MGLTGDSKDLSQTSTISDKLSDDILYKIQKMMSKAASIDFLGLKE